MMETFLGDSVDSRSFATRSSSAFWVAFLGDSVDSRFKVLLKQLQDNTRFWGIVWTAGSGFPLSIIYPAGVFGG